jgi:hypothetical protein
VELGNEIGVDTSSLTLALGPLPQVVNVGVESLRPCDVNK